MRKHYQINPSRILIAVTLAAHCLVMLAIWFYVDTPLLRLGGVCLAVLLCWRESRGLVRQPVLGLSIDPHARSIVLEEGGQPHFYAKYKVYATRWFAILKLIDKRKSRIMILHSERFQTAREYRHLRFALSRMEAVRAA